MKDESIELTRRKLLAAAGAVGTAGAGAGLGTSALFSDSERFEGNTVAAGDFDLKVDWQQRYYWDRPGQERDDHTTWEQVNAYPDADGDGDQDVIETRDEIAFRAYGVVYEDLSDSQEEDVEAEFRDQFADLEEDFELPVIDLDDVKPGDEGEITISMHLFDNPGHIWLGGEVLENAENGVVEPEVGAEGEDDQPGEGGSTSGELLDAIQAELWRDTDCDNVRDTGPACVQLVVDNTDSMGNPFDPVNDPNTFKDQILVDELETLIQGYDAGDDGTLDGVTFGLTLFDDTGRTLDLSTQTFADASASNFTTQTDDEAAILGDTTVVDDGSLPSLEGIQYILDQDLEVGSAHLPNAIDQGSAALGQCPTDEQRVMVLVTNGVHIDTTTYVTKLQENLRLNGGEVDKYVVLGIQNGTNAENVLSSVEGLSGDHEYLNAFTESDVTEAVNGSAPFSGGSTSNSEIDSSIDSEISAASGGQQEPIIAEGSLAEVLDDIAKSNGGVRLDGVPGLRGTQCFQNSSTECVALHWWLPVGVGNEVQSDRVVFDLDFHAEQCRNNENPDSPFDIAGT